MEQIVIRDSIIVEHLDAPELVEGAVLITDFSGYVGSNVNEYDENWVLLPIAERISKGYATLPEGYKLSDQGTAVAMSPEERIVAGLSPVPNGLFIQDGELKPKTLEVLLELGEIDRSEYVSRYNEDVQLKRKTAYSAESDHLYFEEQRGDVSQGAWLAKIAEIKERFPKIV